MTRLVIAEIPENATRSVDVERSILGSDVEIVRHAYDGDDNALMSAVRDADVILTDFVPFTDAIISGLRRCRLLSVSATGYSSIDIDAARNAGISVCAIDEYCTDEVADHVMMLMLALCRRLMEYHDQVQRENRWEFDSLTGLRRLQDTTLGIIGFGRIGQAVARRAASFGLSLIVHDPYPVESLAAETGARYCDLTELFATADIISLNCDLTADNERLIDARAFQAMQKQPILINCARGGLIDEAALVVALDTGQISAAGLDVLTAESPDLPAPGITGRANVILTPHVAFYSDASILENRQISANNIQSYLDGRLGDVRKFIYQTPN